MPCTVVYETYCAFVATSSIDDVCVAWTYTHRKVFALKYTILEMINLTPWCCTWPKYRQRDKHLTTMKWVANWWMLQVVGYMIQSVLYVDQWRYQVWKRWVYNQVSSRPNVHYRNIATCNRSIITCMGGVTFLTLTSIIVTMNMICLPTTISSSFCH